MMSSWRKLVVGVLFLVFTAALPGCTTIPTDAPAEFQVARQAIVAAKRGPAGQSLPATIGRAERALEDGLALLKQSRAASEQQSNESRRYLDAAIGKANLASSLAALAGGLSLRIAAWDGRVEQYFEEEAAVRDLLAAVTGDEESTGTSGAGGCAEALAFDTRVAFFRPGSSELSQRDLPEVGALADLLAAQPHYRVRLTGFADHGVEARSRGAQLARRRALGVAQALADAGVDPDRIEISDGQVQVKDSSVAGEEAVLERHVRAEVFADMTEVGATTTPADEAAAATHSERIRLPTVRSSLSQIRL